jgi:hypothetical protein
MEASSSMTHELPNDVYDTLMLTLEQRFRKNADRHRQLEWSAVSERLQKNPAAMWTLHEMEATGGEPDVVGLDHQTGQYVFYDCSPESPKGRRSLCYDTEALESRKDHKPKNSALGLAKAMRIEILTEEQYRHLQTLGEFDVKTSSWVHTPPDIREAGGALFCDRRFGHVFVYHNGAESYYAARGFRGWLAV